MLMQAQRSDIRVAFHRDDLRIGELLEAIDPVFRTEARLLVPAKGRERGADGSVTATSDEGTTVTVKPRAAEAAE